MFKKLIAGTMVAAFAAMTASAALIAEYDSGVAAAAGASGAADPTAGTGVNAWTVNSAGAGSGYNGGYDTGNGGINMVDGTSSGRYSYEHVFNATEQTELALGWEATFTMALNRDAVNGVGPGGVDNYYSSTRTGAQVFYVDVAGSRTLVTFRQDASGNVTVDNQTIDTGGGVLLQQSEQIGTGSPDMNFVTFTLGWTPGAGSGTSTLSDNFGNSYTVSSSANAGTSIVFGSGSSGGQGSAVYNSVTLNSIPEPATLGMIAAFGGGMLFIRRKLMM